MVSMILRFGIAALLTAFVMPGFYIEAALSFQATRSLEIQTVFLFAVAGVSILLLVWDLDKESAWFRQPWFVAGIVAALWFLGVVVGFRQIVETPGGPTTGPALLFALSSLWAPVLSWLPIWSLNNAARLTLVGGLFVLQGVYPLAFMAKLTDRGAEHSILVHRRFQEPPKSQASRARPPRPEIPPNEKPLAPAPPSIPKAPAGVANWSVYSKENKFAKLPTSSAEQAIIEILPGARELWDVQLSYAPVAVQKDQRVTVQFRIRSDESRLIQLAFSENHQPWQSLGLATESLDIGPEWYDVHRTFTATKTDANGRVQLLLGGDPATISITDLKVSTKAQTEQSPPQPSAKPPASKQPSPTPMVVTPTQPPPQPTPSAPPVAAQPTPTLKGEGAMDPVGWTVFVDADVPATWSFDSAAKLYRVTIAEPGVKEASRVQISRAGFPVEANGRYMVRLQARSNVKRTIQVGVTSLDAPNGNLDTELTTSLSTDWNTIELRFKASTSGEVQLQLGVGGPASVVEISSFTLEKSE